MEQTALKYYEHPDEKIGTLFSKDGKHRLVLWRSWDISRPMAMCVGLNPSTANSVSNDNTITRLCGNKGLLGFNGYGGIYMLNLYTFISTDPKLLDTNSLSPLVLLQEYAQKAESVVYCWGNFKPAIEASKLLIDASVFPSALCFGKNANGSPKHPLYLYGKTNLITF